MYKQLDLKKVKFISKCETSIEAGEYIIELEQVVSGSGEGGKINDKFNNSKKFIVEGERFNIDESGIYSVFPNDNSQVDYNSSLPHIVLKKKNLPWIRKSSNDRLCRDYSWLALLVFLDEEKPIIQEIKIKDFMKNVSNDTFTYDFVKGESSDKNTNIIDLSIDLFKTIAPARDDLRFLVHAREVDITNKSLNFKSNTNFVDTSSSSIDKNEIFSTIIGNRLLATSGRYTVHLVSFEDIGDYLSGGSKFNDLKKYKQIRLISLHSWQFTVNSKKQSISSIFENLNNKYKDNSFLSMPSIDKKSNISKEVSKAYEMGYAVVKYDMRAGDNNIAWYRGPFTPYKVGDKIIKEHNNSADSLLRFNPENQMFDISYAAAWQLGKLLAIQSKNFSGKLYKFKQQAIMYSFTYVKQESLKSKILKIDPGLSTNFYTENDHIRDSNPAEFNNQIKSSITECLINSLSCFDKNQDKKTMTFRNLKIEHNNNYTNLLEDIELLKKIHNNSNTDYDHELDDWLARLELLYNVPFEYLITHEEMLPIESIKFFYIDNNWINALKDGACSLGRETIHEEIHDKIKLPKILSSSKIHSNNIRKLVFKYDQEDRPILFTEEDLNRDDKIITGFIIRSKIVSELPGLELHVYDQDEAELPPIRLDHISDNILLGIYDGLIDKIEICEPTEVLHLGFNPKAKESDNFYEKTLKDKDGKETGKKIKIDDSFYSNKKYNIINIKKLATKLGANTSAEFALQMITGVDKAILENKGAKNVTNFSE